MRLAHDSTNHGRDMGKSRCQRCSVLNQIVNHAAQSRKHLQNFSSLEEAQRSHSQASELSNTCKCSISEALCIGPCILHHIYLDVQRHVRWAGQWNTQISSAADQAHKIFLCVYMASRSGSCSLKNRFPASPSTKLIPGQFSRPIWKCFYLTKAARHAPVCAGF